MTINLTTKVRLRAAMAVLLLALGWLAVPASMVVREPDVCGMECCIEEGFCCCVTRRAYVEGQETEPDEIAFNIQTELRAPCPAGCAGSTPSAQIVLLRFQSAPAPAVAAAILPARYEWGTALLHYPFAAQPSSPRAPPFCV